MSTHETIMRLRGEVPEREADGRHFKPGQPWAVCHEISLVGWVDRMGHFCFIILTQDDNIALAYRFGQETVQTWTADEAGHIVIPKRVMAQVRKARREYRRKVTNS